MRHRQVRLDDGASNKMSKSRMNDAMVQHAVQEAARDQDHIPKPYHLTTINPDNCYHRIVSSWWKDRPCRPANDPCGKCVAYRIPCLVVHGKSKYVAYTKVDDPCDVWQDM